MWVPYVMKLCSRLVVVVVFPIEFVLVYSSEITVFWNGQNKSAIFIAKVMSWWWFWGQNVPDNGPSHCNRCSLRIFYTLCAFRDPEWYCGTWWPPEAGGNGAVAAFRSKDNTGGGNQPPARCTRPVRVFLHPLLSVDNKNKY